MINVKELRIGNLISDYQNNTIKVLGISDVYNDGNYYIISENGGSIDDDHKPIPLTPEILLKCGFTSDKWLMSFHLGENKMWIDKTSNEFYWVFGRKETKYLRIKYLHQLQNLFYSLTNEELNINL